jgi:phosphate transport system protein
VVLAEEVFKKEEESDLINLSVDEGCLRLTALQQPVAKDLRFISSMIKISDNYERVCDLGGKIAEITQKISKRPLIKPLIHIPQMDELIAEMIDLNTEAISNWKADHADSLLEKEERVDKLYDIIHGELLNLMTDDPIINQDAVDLMFVARYLERIADIVAKTGARIVYMIEGRRVWIK